MFWFQIQKFRKLERERQCSSHNILLFLWPLSSKIVALSCHTTSPFFSTAFTFSSPPFIFTSWHFQFPSMMEFLPSFLINVWDSALTPVFHTFLFDCDHDRALALQVYLVKTEMCQPTLCMVTWLQAPDSPPARYSVWAWETQFTQEQVTDLSDFHWILISKLNVPLTKDPCIPSF